MTAPLHPARKCRNYEPHEDTIICQMWAGKRTYEDIGLRLDRSAVAIEQRVCRLRREGVIPGYSPRRKALEVQHGATSMGPPLTLRDDDRLVRLSLSEGGFPRAVITAHGTAWAGPDGMPWRHRPKEQNRDNTQARGRLAA